MGVSRNTFYCYRERADEGGVDALINRSRRAPNLKSRTYEATEQAVFDYAVAFPAHGQHRTSNELRKQGVFISGSGVRSIWLRHNLGNFKKRLKALEEKVARDGIELTDRLSAILPANMFLQQGQCCHAAVTHNLFVGNDRHINQRKIAGVQFPGQRRIIKLLQPVGRVRVRVWSAFAGIEKYRDDQ
ncbi:winged helix-turn helix protein [Serratia sp. 121840015-2]